MVLAVALGCPEAFFSAAGPRSLKFLIIQSMVLSGVALLAAVSMQGETVLMQACLSMVADTSDIRRQGPPFVPV